MSKVPSAYDHGSTSQVSDDKDKRLAEERDKRLAEERAQAALKLQRKQRLEAMVQKRKTNLAYLKVGCYNSCYYSQWRLNCNSQKVHEGGCYWLNIVLFTSADIKQYIDVQITKQRTESYFYLGLSVSKILSLPAGISTVRAFSQLVEEWEYYHNGNTLQSVKYVMAKNSSCMYPQVTPLEGGGMTDLQRPSVYKFNQTIVYEYLHIMHIPYQLDHVEVLIGLCDALSKLYDKILHEECYRYSFHCPCVAGWCAVQ